jgi:tripartite-type tricarboxylate transporter receptor subunit TctC
MYKHRAALAAVAMLCWPALAWPQNYPAKPVRMIVAFPPGGGTDIVARMLATRLSSVFGQQVVVDNRPGADGILGTELAAKAPPDGLTWLLGTAGNLAINQTLYPKVSFDIARDFAAVTQVVSVDMMLTVHPSLPVKNVAGLVALAKSRPSDLNYASTGTGGIPHLAMELFNHTAKTRIHHVPYKGGSPALADVTGGHVPMMVQSLVQGMPIVKSGKLRAIALMSAKRAALLPDVPAAVETLPGCEATNWFGLMLPAATPAAIHKRVYDEVVRLLRSAELRDQLVAQGAEPVGSTPEQYAAFLKSETAKWARVIKDANIRPDQ